MESLHANFRNGANFAVDVGDLLHPRAPFSLTLQVLQFLRFQKRSLELIANGMIPHNTGPMHISSLAQST